MGLKKQIKEWWKSIAAAAVVSIAAILVQNGILTTGDEPVIDPVSTNTVATVETAFPAATQEKEAEGQTPEGTGETASAHVAAGDSSVEFSALRFQYGGFKASSSAKECARIGSLRVSDSGLSYKWESGGCEQLGASGKTDASCLACLFVKRGGDWVGGKFDWISTSRLTRGFENIRDGYNGWPKDAVSSANEFVFVILSKDGKKRTNVAYFKR